MPWNTSINGYTISTFTFFTCFPLYIFWLSSWLHVSDFSSCWFSSFFVISVSVRLRVSEWRARTVRLLLSVLRLRPRRPREIVGRYSLVSTGYTRTHLTRCRRRLTLSRSSRLARSASVSLAAFAPDSPNLLLRRPRNKIAYLGSRFWQRCILSSTFSQLSEPTPGKSLLGMSLLAPCRAAEIVLFSKLKRLIFLACREDLVKYT